MNKKYIFALLVFLAVLLFLFIFYFVFKPVQKVEPEVSEEKIEDQKVKEYGDAPKPNLDPEEIFKLWPDLAQKMEIDKEKIDQEWIDFARKYPDNFYIPTKYLNLTEKQKEERIKELENFADIEAKLSAQKAKLEKESKVGIDGPEPPEKPSVTPDEQKSYFDYKIRELQSRIQLIEYWIENQNIDPQQKKMAEEDLQQWKKELSEYENIRKQIP
ncbi:MAG: hypothetical protein ACK4UJ_11725 [Leptonema sp. (in: bacteria)]